MKQFLRHIFLLLALFVATANAWAEDCTYTLSDKPSNVNVVQTGSLGLIKYHNFPNTTLCTLTNSYGVSKISFNMKKDGGTNNGDFKLQFYNGSSWEDAKDASSNSITWNVKNSNTTTVSREINPNSLTGKASKFQIVRTSNTNFTSSSRYFTISNIVVVMAKTLSGSEETMDLGNQVYNTTSGAQTRIFTFSNVATGKSISITNNTNATEFPAEIDKNVVDCTGSVTVSVSFKPSQKGTRTGQITISGDCGSKTFTVTGNGLVATPTLTLKKTTGLVDRTTDVAKPNYIDLGDFIDTYIGDGYKYEVVSSNSQYAHFDGDNFYATEKGEYTIHITSPAGDHYSDTFADDKKYREIFITVRDKARPGYKMNYTQSEADGMLVDGTIENAYVLTNVSNDGYFSCNISVISISDVNDGSGRVISYDAENNKIIAHNAGTATLQFVQTENNDYYGGASPIYTFIVSKHQTSFSGEAYSMMVDSAQIANYLYTNTSSAQPTASNSDDFYYTIDEVNFANEELNKGTDLITFNPSTKQITACNAGTAKITLHQKETYKYIGATASYNVTVNKHTPVFTLNPEVSSSPEKLYFNKEYPDYFTTTANTPLTLTSSDTLVAKWVQGSNPQSYTLKTFSKTNTATLTAIQHENYYWQRWEGSVEIQLQNAKNHVQIDVTESNYKDLIVDSYYGLTWNNGGVQVGDGGGGFNYEDKYIIIQFEGIPDSLFFNAVGTSGSISYPEYYIQQGTSQDNLSATKEGRVDTRDYNAALPLDPTTRCVKICYSGNFGTVFKNVRITERKEFYASVENTTTRIEELNFNKDANGNYKENKVNDPVELTFYFQYANIGHDVVLSTNDSDHFTITPNRLKNLGGEQTGRVPITVTYKSTAAYETENSKLYIEDELNNKDSIELTAITTKKDQSITWNDKYNNGKLIIGQEVADAATATSKGEILYSIANDDNSDVIEIINGGAAFRAKAPGTATIIATQAGNDEWNSVTDTTEFTVTTKTIQYIHWTDNLTRLVVGGEPVQLTATAQILLNAETEEIIDALERTALITYQSANDNVVTINGTTLTIVGEGETTVTATLPGDDIYEATSSSMPVRVRVPSTVCEAYVLDAPEEYSYAAATAGSYTPVDFTGPGHILTFQARSGNSTRVGPIIFEQYVNGEWKKLDEGNPDTDWRDYRYELDRNATKVRFRNEAGSYRRYFKNVLVTQATYLETTTPEITVEKSIVGDEIRRDILVQYSNIPAGATITHNSDDFTISADELDSDCGEYGEQVITISVRPSAVGTVEDVVTIHDEVTGLRLNIPITIHTQMTEQNLYWDVPTQPITSCSDLQLPTRTTAELAINWSVIEGSEYAILDANGHLLIYATGNVTLQAANAGNAIYAPFSQTYTIPVAYDPIFLGTENNDWDDPNNWSVCHLPTETDVVTVQASAVLEEHVTVGGLIFNEGGSIEIRSTGGLTVGDRGITGAKDDGSSIIIDNTPQGAGFLKVDPTTDNKPAKVTVNYATEAYNSGNPRDEIWQYMGAPGNDMQMSDANNTMIYHWNEQQGWLKMSNTNLQPFVGYAFTQNKADSASFQIQATPIIPNDVQEIELTVTPAGMGGSNLFVNSFLAPIDLAKFTGNEFEGEVDKTFYLFNSGSWKDWQGEGGSNHMNYGVSPGQYYALSPKGASLMDKEYDQTTIPSMQGVYVIARENGAKIKLDYAKHVYRADASNQPMRAPERVNEDFKRVRLHVNSQNSGADRMYVIQHEAGTAGYDNGYDARNMAVNGQVAIYTHELDGQMEISVSDKIDSTYIGFRAGSDSEYTLRMTSVVGEEMYLKDLVDNILIPVVDGQDYTFSATPNSVNDTRFLLLGQKSGVATDIEEVHVYIHDNMVHVMEAPQNSSMSIYTVGGVTVANYSIGYAPCTIDLLGLPTGVYVLRINDKAYKFVCK